MHYASNQPRIDGTAPTPEEQRRHRLRNFWTFLGVTCLLIALTGAELYVQGLHRVGQPPGHALPGIAGERLQAQRDLAPLVIEAEDLHRDRLTDPQLVGRPSDPRVRDLRGRDEALNAADLEAAQGADPNAWRADATLERIEFAPGLLPYTMRYTNRPSGIQQVIEFRGHRKVGRRR
mgnify:CR=1 FL=1